MWSLYLFLGKKKQGKSKTIHACLTQWDLWCQWRTCFFTWLLPLERKELKQQWGGNGLGCCKEPCWGLQLWVSYFAAAGYALYDRERGCVIMHRERESGKRVTTQVLHTTYPGIILRYFLFLLLHPCFWETGFHLQVPSHSFHKAVSTLVLINTHLLLLIM